MVAAQKGNVTFVGLKTRATYNKAIYCSDVAGALVTWDSGQGAGVGTDSFWIAPEIVVLKDFTCTTGLAAVTQCQLIRNGVPTGDVLLFTNHLPTVQNRPVLGVIFARGAKVSAIQLA